MKKLERLMLFYGKPSRRQRSRGARMEAQQALHGPPTSRSLHILRPCGLGSTKACGGSERTRSSADSASRRIWASTSTGVGGVTGRTPASDESPPEPSIPCVDTARVIELLPGRSRGLRVMPALPSVGRHCSHDNLLLFCSFICSLSPDP